MKKDPTVTKIRNVDGDTALHFAAREGDPETVAKLLQTDSSQVNLQNNFGRTPLHEAAESGSATVASHLMGVSHIDYTIQDTVSYLYRYIQLNSLS